MNGDETTTVMILLAHGLAISDEHGKTIVNEAGRE